MKSFLPLLFAASIPAAAQDIAPKDNERDPVLLSLLEDSEVDPEEAVTLALEVEPDVMEEPELGEEPTEKDEPVLVTGNPPEDAHLMDHETGDESVDDVETDETGEMIVPVDVLEPIEEAKEPSDPSGVRVEVEPGTTTSRYAAKDIKLVAPFPAKPLSAPPIGWRLVHPESAPPISETVQLANGSSITLSIRPHVLVPDADGSKIFAISEPGYDPALGYAQKHTIGSVLADTINELDRNGDRLDAASQRLSELLDSLPMPVAEPEKPADQPAEEP